MTDKVSLAVILCAVTLSAPAYAASQAKVECWKRLSDGDVDADTSKYPQFSSGLKVISFKANRKDAEWSYGTCVLAPRK